MSIPVRKMKEQKKGKRIVNVGSNIRVKEDFCHFRIVPVFGKRAFREAVYGLTTNALVSQAFGITG